MENKIEFCNPTKPIQHFMIGILAVATAIPGGILLFSGIYFGLVPMLFWLSTWTFKTGMQISFEPKQIRSFREYLWLRVYKDFRLDDYTHFKLKRSKEAYALNTRVQSMNVHTEYLCIELLNNTRQQFEKVAFGNKDQIIDIARKLESDFGLERIVKK